MYEEDADKWLASVMAWESGADPDRAEHPEYRYYWDWDTGPPERESYRPAYTSEPTHFQVYENVSEGTPLSPVFATLEELVQWLIGEGHSEHAARAFAESGWAPSFALVGGSAYFGIDAHDALGRR